MKRTKSARPDEVEWRDFCSFHAVTASVIYYSSHVRENVIYLFHALKIQMVYCKDLEGMKKEKQV